MTRGRGERDLARCCRCSLVRATDARAEFTISSFSIGPADELMISPEPARLDQLFGLLGGWSMARRGQRRLDKDRCQS